MAQRGGNGWRLGAAEFGPSWGAGGDPAAMGLALPASAEEGSSRHRLPDG